MNRLLNRVQRSQVILKKCEKTHSSNFLSQRALESSFNR